MGIFCYEAIPKPYRLIMPLEQPALGNNLNYQLRKSLHLIQLIVVNHPICSLQYFHQQSKSMSAPIRCVYGGAGENRTRVLLNYPFGSSNKFFKFFMIFILYQLINEMSRHFKVVGVTYFFQFVYVIQGIKHFPIDQNICIH